MSTKSWMWLGLAVLIIVLFSAYWYEDEIRGYPAPGQRATTTAQAPQAAGIANPASTNCVVTLGGTLEIVDEMNGAVGYCHLKDGRVCEEWALFRDNSCVSPQ